MAKRYSRRQILAAAKSAAARIWQKTKGRDAMNTYQPPVTPDAAQAIAYVDRQQPSPPTAIKRHPIPSRASANQQSGHDWRQTTSDEYRTCQRPECTRVQRIYRGYWVNVQASDTPLHMPGSVPIQQHLFDNLS